MDESRPGLWAFFSFFCTMAFCWWLVREWLAFCRSRIRSRWRANVIGWFVGLVLGVAAGAVFAAGLGIEVWALPLLCVAAVWALTVALRRYREPHTPPAQALPVLHTPYSPTPEQLEQIERARQSSLASLQADERRRKAQKKKAASSVPPIALPDLVEFTYRKPDGTTSQRVVNVSKTDGMNVMGWCQNSGAVKTFKVDRIQGQLVRHETGELMDPMAWLFSLQKPAKRR